MRAIWSGALSFGLINIPVRLYSATKSQALSFHLVEEKTRCPISYLKVCRATGEEIAYEDIAKAYEYEKGEYVILSKDDFKNAQAKKTDTIDLISFTREDEIDIKLFEKPYFIEPDKKAHKAYALLRDALEKAQRVGIGRFVMRDREHLAVIKTEGNVMILNQLRFQTEVRDSKELSLPAKKNVYSKKEFEFAQALIEKQTEPFRAEAFTDHYTEQLMQVINQKASGRKPLAKGEKPEMFNEDLADILTLLEKSLKKTPA